MISRFSVTAAFTAACLTMPSALPADDVEDAIAVFKTSERLVEELVDTPDDVTLDDLRKIYTEDIISVSSDGPTVGLKNVKASMDETCKGLRKAISDGAVFDMKFKNHNAKALTPDAIIVTSEQTTFITVKTQTTRLVHTNVSVLVRTGSTWRISLESSSKKK